MLIRRCAWHREFHRYPIVHGVATWGGLSIAFTDGVCRSCAARVRLELRLARPPSSDAPLPRGALARTTPLRHLGASVGLALAAAILPLVSSRLARRATAGPTRRAAAPSQRSGRPRIRRSRSAHAAGD